MSESNVWNGQEKPVFNNEHGSLSIYEQRCAEAQADKWVNFWTGIVEYEDNGEQCLRYEWVHNFIHHINAALNRRNYVFAFPPRIMKRKMMFWLYALYNAGKKGGRVEVMKVPAPPLHEKHRDKHEDFIAFDYAFDFSGFWIQLIDNWATIDMTDYEYINVLKSDIELFVYSLIDTANSNAIIKADREAQEIEDAQREADEERYGRHDDRKRDSYYQDAGYYKGNREYN
jgi:hypothetical protein